LMTMRSMMGILVKNSNQSRGMRRVATRMRASGNSS
jgi:hypothetical protein